MNDINRPGIIRLSLAILLAGFVVLFSVVAIAHSSPQLGAQGADFIRNLIGPKPTAYLEEIVFKIQDSINQIQYKLGRKAPETPWQVAVATVAPQSHEPPAGIPQPSQTARPGNSKAVIPNHIPPAIDQTPPPIPPSPLAPASSPWMLASLKALGNLPGEGAWTPYIFNLEGAAVAYRTFLQPDPKRPYVVVGVVAIDLGQVHLHYELGSVEPYVPGSPKRSGSIPAGDRSPGTLLAAFNGGFKTINGHFGVMENHVVLIPPINKMGTIAFYKNGSIRIGEWGTDLSDTPDMVSFRQNCPLIVHNGAINPLVYNNSINDWGGTIQGSVITFRSGLGISQDGKVLYYFAGQNLTMQAMASAMQDAGAYQAMQLDINNYYVLFTSFQVVSEKLTGIPLLPKDMVDNLNRFLGNYSRDFFYITSANP